MGRRTVPVSDLDVIAEARLLFEYNGVTGDFVWAVNRYRSATKGRKAGSINNTSGYRQLTVLGRTILAHRLAVMLTTGVPISRDMTVDHINGIRVDNRLINLRVVSHSVNSQNMRRAKKTNSTGMLGVTRLQKKTKTSYRASIVVKGRAVYLGTFDTPELAHDAYLAAKRRLHIGCCI